MPKSIAIDGYAGSGKGTLANLLGQKLNFLYLDTGAMYRSLAVKCIREGITADDETAIRKVIDNLNFQIKYEEGKQKNYLDGEEVSSFIREEKVGMMASTISKYQFVRDKLVSMQRDLAGKIDIILEGRDIGTVVLPNANIKFFLTASPEIRAKRRLKQLSKSESEYKTILEDIKKRDHQDVNRDHSPLKMAEDAYLVDSTNMTIEEVVNYCMALINENLK